jgi:hypothetical protein
MDDGEVAHDPHAHIVRFKVRDRRRPRYLRQKLRAVDERTVGIAVEEVIGQYLVEPAGIGDLDRPYVVLIELPQDVDIGVIRNGVSFHGSRLHQGFQDSHDRNAIDFDTERPWTSLSIRVNLNVSR